jgi:hypothetical protein
MCEQCLTCAHRCRLVFSKCVSCAPLRRAAGDSERQHKKSKKEHKHKRKHKHKKVCGAATLPGRPIMHAAHT